MRRLFLIMYGAEKEQKRSGAENQRGAANEPAPEHQSAGVY